MPFNITYQADTKKQSLGYQSFLAAWGDDLRLNHEMSNRLNLAGVFFYTWDPYYAGEAEDRGYGVKGKPAEDILRKWLGETS